MLKFPYAFNEFERLINGGYVYIDRTDKIRLIEEWGDKLLFLRPRRFGKSLWLSTMIVVSYRRLGIEYGLALALAEAGQWEQSLEKFSKLLSENESVIHFHTGF